MKIETLTLQVGQESSIDICVDKPSDYYLLTKLIQIGDKIETKVRRKDKSLKIPIFFAIVEILVENIEFIPEQNETIHISGIISTSYNQNLKEGTKQSIWITDGCNLKLFKKNWKKEDLKIIDEIFHPVNADKINKNMVSDPNLQKKCFEILHKYMAKKFNLVMYGNETLDALENGSIKVLLVTDDFIERQNDQWKNKLLTEEHKYHGGNIVIYNKGTSNWEELTNFGGIIGVLKYDIAPSQTTNFD